MLVYSEDSHLAKQSDGTWKVIKHTDIRWTWMPLDRNIRKSIRKWVPNDATDHRNGETEQWAYLSAKEIKIRDIALQNKTDEELKPFANLVKEKEADWGMSVKDMYSIEEQEVNEFVDMYHTKEPKNAKKRGDPKPKEVTKEKPTSKANAADGAPAGGKAENVILLDQITKLKAENMALLRQNDICNQDILNLQNNLTAIPAAIRLMNEKDLEAIKSKANNHDTMKAAVLTYFETQAMYAKTASGKKETVKNLMPKSLAKCFDEDDLM